MERGSASHGFSIDIDDDISSLNACLRGGGSSFNRRYHSARLTSGVQGCCYFRGEILKGNADPTPLHLTVSDKLPHDATRDVHGDRKSDPDVPTPRR